MSPSREPTAAQTDDIKAGQACAVAHGERIRDHVLLDAGDAADHRVFADAYILMHARETADDGELADLDVAAEGDVIRQDDVVADDAIVRNV